MEYINNVINERKLVIIAKVTSKMVSNWRTQVLGKKDTLSTQAREMFLLLLQNELLVLLLLRWHVFRVLISLMYPHLLKNGPVPDLPQPGNFLVPKKDFHVDHRTLSQSKVLYTTTSSSEEPIDVCRLV